MPIFNKKSNSGQSVLEYSIILLLVMAGIIIGGPYAIRGWNAHLKGWDDSIKISIQDPLEEVPPGTVDIPDCACGPWGNGGCDTDSPTNPDGPCSGTQMYQSQICTPLGCNDPSPSERCVSDTSCCIPDLSNQPTLPDDCGSTTIDCGLDVWGNPIYCAPNEACFGFLCSDSMLQERRCVADAACYTCTGTLPPEGPPFGPPSPPLGVGKKCIGDWTGLTAFTPIIPVVNGGCTAGTKCEFECEPPYFPVGGTCDTCDPFEVYQGNCSVNQCEGGMGSCGSDECMGG